MEVIREDMRAYGIDEKIIREWKSEGEMYEELDPVV